MREVLFEGFIQPFCRQLLRSGSQGAPNQCKGGNLFLFHIEFRFKLTDCLALRELGVLFHESRKRCRKSCESVFLHRFEGFQRTVEFAEEIELVFLNCVPGLEGTGEPGK
jgi:hypothetical protein